MKSGVSTERVGPHGGFGLPSPRLHQKRAPTEADALAHCANQITAYIFFAEQMFVLASHTPPAFAQSAAVFAAVTLPANAGPVKASAKATARIETRVFDMGASLSIFVDFPIRSGSGY